MRKPKALDLFAGAGGLSQGLRQAGFSVQAAVELDPLCAQVFKANHPKSRMYLEDIRNIKASDVVTYEGIELVAGCAPCQGFSSLTRKNQCIDERNKLVFDMARIVEILKPAAVFMENVPGLADDAGREYLEPFLARLRNAGYYYQYKIVQMADYGLPQRRRRLVLLAGRGFTIPFPVPTHSRSKRGELPAWRTVRDAIGGFPNPVRLAASWKDGGPQRHSWHVVRDLKDQTRDRLVAAIPGRSWHDVDEALRPRCHRGGYNGFTNVYGRMTWDEPAPTITGGCTTPAKGRFGHPDRRRHNTISVREAATLQSFPDSYRFPTDYIDRVCLMIGNAVPPAFAETVGRSILSALRRHR